MGQAPALEQLSLSGKAVRKTFHTPARELWQIWPKHSHMFLHVPSQTDHMQSLGHRSTCFPCKGPNSQYFRLCWPCGLSTRRQQVSSGSPCPKVPCDPSGVGICGYVMAGGFFFFLFLSQICSKSCW